MSTQSPNTAQKPTASATVPFSNFAGMVPNLSGSLPLPASQIPQMPMPTLADVLRSSLFSASSQGLAFQPQAAAALSLPFFPPQMAGQMANGAMLGLFSKLQQQVPQISVDTSQQRQAAISAPPPPRAPSAQPIAQNVTQNAQTAQPSQPSAIEHSVKTNETNSQSLFTNKQTRLPNGELSPPAPTPTEPPSQQTSPMPSHKSMMVDSLTLPPISTITQNAPLPPTNQSRSPRVTRSDFESASSVLSPPTSSSSSGPTPCLPDGHFECEFDTTTTSKDPSNLVPYPITRPPTETSPSPPSSFTLIPRRDSTSSSSAKPNASSSQKHPVFTPLYHVMQEILTLQVYQPSHAPLFAQLEQHLSSILSWVKSNPNPTTTSLRLMAKQVNMSPDGTWPSDDSLPILPGPSSFSTHGDSDFLVPLGTINDQLTVLETGHHGSGSTRLRAAIDADPSRMSENDFREMTRDVFYYLQSKYSGYQNYDESELYAPSRQHYANTRTSTAATRRSKRSSGGLGSRQSSSSSLYQDSYGSGGGGRRGRAASNSFGDEQSYRPMTTRRSARASTLSDPSMLFETTEQSTSLDQIPPITEIKSELTENPAPIVNHQQTDNVEMQPPVGDSTSTNEFAVEEEIPTSTTTTTDAEGLGAFMPPDLLAALCDAAEIEISTSNAPSPRRTRNRSQPNSVPSSAFTSPLGSPARKRRAGQRKSAGYGWSTNSDPRQEVLDNDDPSWGDNLSDGEGPDRARGGSRLTRSSARGRTPRTSRSNTPGFE